MEEYGLGEKMIRISLDILMIFKDIAYCQLKLRKFME
jgi:hypothetical protein